MKVSTKKTPEKVINSKYEKSPIYYQTSQYVKSQNLKSSMSNIPSIKKSLTKGINEPRSKSKSKKQTFKTQLNVSKTSNDKRKPLQKSNQKFPTKKTFLPKRLCVDSKYDELLARLTQLEQSNLSLCKQFNNTFIDIEKQIKKVNQKIGGITDDVAGIKIELKQNQQDISVLIELMAQQTNLSIELNPNQMTKNISNGDISLKRKTSTKKTRD